MVSTCGALMVASSGSSPRAGRPAAVCPCPQLRGAHRRTQRPADCNRGSGADHPAGRSWRELHSGLAVEGMRYEKKGSGALIWIGEQPVKASTAGRDCSMAALRDRWAPSGWHYRHQPPRRCPREPSTNRRPHCGAYLDERRRALPRTRDQTGASNP